MNIQLYRDRLANLQFGVKSLLAVILGLVVALVANGFFMRQVIVQVTPVEVTRPYEVSGSTASPDYYRQMALSLLPLVTNVTPTSVDVGHEAFRRYVRPAGYARIVEALAADAQYIKQYQISRVFWPDQVEQQGGRVTLIGREERRMAGSKVAEEERAYTLVMRVKDYHVEVDDFQVASAAEYRQSRLAVR